MKIVGDLWRNKVADEYWSGRITTERCLQAVLYRFLRDKDADKNAGLEIFVEP